MARGNRQPATSLIDSLFAAPHTFRFFQAVRLLELARNNADPGSSVSPSLDPVRFRVLPSGSLPNSEITSLQAENDKPPEMTVAFMGLTGPTGVEHRGGRTSAVPDATPGRCENRGSRSPRGHVSHPG